MIAAPLFHSWGFFHFVHGPADRPRRSCCGAASTRRRRCGPCRTHRAQVLAVVPVMLQRILAAAGGDARRLRPLLAADHLALAARRCRASWRSRGWTASATSSTTSTARPRSPARPSPPPRTCARRPAPPAGRRAGPTCALYDEAGREVPRGEVGRIFVGNEMSFEGYTGGGGKEAIDGLLLQRRRRPLRRRAGASSSTAATTR